MGTRTDIDDLLGQDTRERRRRALWSLGTVVVSVVCTTGTVTWKVRGYIAELEASNQKLHDRIAIMDKNIETLTGELSRELRDLRHEVQEARGRADSALLVAQLTARKDPNGR